jgi:hypothetical protein
MLFMAIFPLDFISFELFHPTQYFIFPKRVVCLNEIKTQFITLKIRKIIQIHIKKAL